MYNGYCFILGLDELGHRITSGVKISHRVCSCDEGLKDVNDRNWDSLDTIFFSNTFITNGKPQSELKTCKE